MTRKASKFPSSATKAAFSESKAALVVGNSAYQEVPLCNPRNDAGDLAEVLQDCGFVIDLLLDADRRIFIEAIDDFGKKLHRGGVGLFYYAGHGQQAGGRITWCPLERRSAKRFTPKMKRLMSTGYWRK